MSAKGYQKGDSELRRIVISFDSETFEAIRSKADTEKTSFAEQVRTFVTWGMEGAE